MRALLDTTKLLGASASASKGRPTDSPTSTASPARATATATPSDSSARTVAVTPAGRRVTWQPTRRAPLSSLPPSATAPSEREAPAGSRSHTGSRSGPGAGGGRGGRASIAPSRDGPCHHAASGCAPPATGALRLTPSRPASGTQESAPSRQPAARSAGVTSATMPSKRACDHSAASILLTATMRCDTPDARASAACSRVCPPPTLAACGAAGKRKRQHFGHCSTAFLPVIPALRSRPQRRRWRRPA
jgi:hypothetical protein